MLNLLSAWPGAAAAPASSRSRALSLALAFGGLCIALSAPASSSQGTIKFQGQIAPAPCAVSSLAAGVLVLADCPLSSWGSRLEIASLAPASAAHLVDLAAGTSITTLVAPSPDLAVFSVSLKIQPDQIQTVSGPYLITIEYL